MDIELRTFLEVRNFGNTLDMSFIFFYKKFSKFHMHLKTLEKIEKKFFVSEIILSELVALNCLY